MDRKQLLVAGAAAGAGTLAAAAPAAARSGDQGLVGSWFSTITAVSPPLGSFNGLMSVHEGGVVTEARRYFVAPPPPFPPLLETSGHGAWERRGNRSYEIFFRFLLQEPPPGAGNPIGTDNIRLRVELDGDRLVGTFHSEVKDVAGTVLIAVDGTYEAERIRV